MGVTPVSSTPHDQSTLKVYSAETFYLRLRGLLGRRQLQEDEALHLQPCKDVHTFGMKYDLDIVFLDDAGSVIKIDSLEPNRWAFCKGARSVLEFKAGCAQLHGYDEHLEEAVPLIHKDIVKQSIGERV